MFDDLTEIEAEIVKLALADLVASFPASPSEVTERAQYDIAVMLLDGAQRRCDLFD